ncbi:hypothetical protein ACWCY6_11370 [Streptomyces sp. 900105755]
MRATEATSKSSASASDSASATATSAAERPEIKLPSDLSYAFEWSKTGDEKKDAVLGDTEQFIKAVDMAIADQDPLDEAYRFYSEGAAAAGSQKFIQEFVDYKDRITWYEAFLRRQGEDQRGWHGWSRVLRRPDQGVQQEPEDREDRGGRAFH